MTAWFDWSSGIILMQCFKNSAPTIKCPPFRCPWIWMIWLMTNHPWQVNYTVAFLESSCNWLMYPTPTSHIQLVSSLILLILWLTHIGKVCFKLSNTSSLCTIWLSVMVALSIVGVAARSSTHIWHHQWSSCQSDGLSPTRWPYYIPYPQGRWVDCQHSAIVCHKDRLFNNHWFETHFLKLCCQLLVVLIGCLFEPIYWFQ